MLEDRNAVLVEASGGGFLWSDDRIEKAVWKEWEGGGVPLEGAAELMRFMRDEYEAKVGELLKYIAILEGVTGVKISFDVD